MRIRTYSFTTLLIAIFSSLIFGHAVAATQPKHGGTVVVAMSQSPRTLNPAIQSGMATGIPGTQLFASPLRYDDDWNPQPYLAKSWDLAPDGKSLTLHLRENAVFHDGKPITSEDVAFSINVIKENHPFQTMFEPIEKVETPDPHTAIIRMSKPNPAILLSMSPDLCPILPKHVYGKGDIMTNPHNNDDVVGSGPFEFVGFTPGRSVELKRFDKFFMSDRPYLDRLIVQVASDPSTALLGIQRGDIDVLALFRSPHDVKRLSKDPNLEMTSKGYAGIGAIYWVEFNLDREPFDDIKVRKAIAYAIDRGFINDTLMLGLASDATGPITPKSPFYTADVNKYSVDLDKAADLLDEAGYKPDASGTRLSVTMDNIPGGPGQIAQYFKSQLGKIGVNVTVRSSPDFPTWAKRMAAHDFQMSTDVVWNWGDPRIGVGRTYRSSNIKNVVWTNVMSYRNSEVDELLAQAATEMDSAKRKDLYTEFQKQVVADVPIYYINTGGYKTVYKKGLANVPENIWGMLSPFDKTYWKTESQR